MAAIKPLKGTLLLIKIGDGEASETFAHDCLINTDRDIDFTAGTNSEQIPDCADPDLMAWDSVEVVSLGCTVSGAGMLNTPDVKTWFAWLKSGDGKNIRIEMQGIALADGGGWWEGEFKLTRFQVGGGRGAKANCNVTLVANGEVAWVDAAA